MVAEYTRKIYNPAAERWTYLAAEAMTRVRALSMWKNNVKSAWSQLSIEDVDVQIDDGKKVCHLNVKQPQLEVGSSLRVTAKVHLGELRHEDVAVEIYYGMVDSMCNIESGEVARMEYQSDDDQSDATLFAGNVICRTSGQHGFAIRILPKHEDMVEDYEPGMITWETS
jgi:starch phosphorylase